MEGVLVCSIPFTHPAHVPQILVYLRQQALFNCLIASCVRPMARQDPEHTTILEVSALSWQHISVGVEHPYEETMATVELDLTDISTLKCRLYGVSMTTNAEQTSDLSGRVLQRCLSIPLTMRTLLKIWEGRSLPAVMNNLTSGSGSSNGSYNLNLGSGGKDQTGQNASGTASGIPDFTNGETKVKQEPGLNNGSNGCMGGRQTQQQQQSSSNQLQQQQQQQQQSFLDAGTENSIGFPSYSGQSDTTTMTMGTAGMNNASTSMLNPLQLGALLGQAKNSLSGNSNTNERGKKARKRKTGTDGLWRSPKRKSDGGDSSTATEILLESSSSENSTPLGTPTSGRENLASETRTSTPTSATSLTSGIDFSNLDTDILDKSTSDYDLDNSERDSEIMEVQHSGTEQQQQQQQSQQDVEELMKMRESSSTRKSKKNRSSGGSEEKKSSPTNIFVDETSTTSGSNKGLPVPPSVSITPISCGNLDQTSTTNYNSVLTGMGLERRPGIEIIPIASSPSQTNLPSSITITPIAGPTSSSKTSGLTSATEDRQRSERKSGGGKSSSSSSKNSSEDKSGGNKLEKRRKRKREDGPMGPPDKVPSGSKQQQDPLSKPVSVSIKPSTEQSPPSGSSAGVGLSCSSSRPTSPAAVRKFSPSPTHSSSLATLVGKSSPTLKAGQSAAATCGKPVQSPKHSPVYGSSPKHNAPNVPVVPMSLSVSTVPNTVGNVPSVAVSVPVPVPASASPKHGSTSSPKHGSSAASSGKPSMSALKSAANSPSSKSSSSSSDTAPPSKVKSSSSSGKDSSGRGDKERRTSSVSSSSGSSGHQSPKTKSSSGKLKQLEMIPPAGGEANQVSSLQASGGSTPPSGQVDAASKSAIAAQQARNRKSSLNAVIDKLKNAQHCTDIDACGNGGSTVKGSGSSSLGGNTGGMSSTGQKEKSIGGGGSSSSSSGGKTIVEGGKSSSVTKNASVDTKNPAEYMVKHSSDGIKITINKTRTKDSKQSATNLKLSSSSSGTMAATSSSSSLSSVASSSSSSSSNAITGSNGSPKTHTGLKPGVNSGPASKKPQTLQTAQKLLPTKMMLAAGIKSTISSSGGTNTGGTSITGATATGGVGGNPLSKSGSSKASGSPKTSSGATDLSRGRDKPRIPKSGDKGIFASKSLGDARKSSPSALREESESERAFKLLAAHASISSLPPSLPPQLVMEGLMKQLDTKFQIPKLSARANVADADKNKSSDKLSILPDSKQTLDGLKQEQGKIAGLSNVTVSVSKSSLPDDQSRRDHSQNKPDNLSITTSAGTMSLNLVGENAGGLMLPPQSAADPDVPTNLCIQPMVDNELSRDSCKDLGIRQTSTSQQFLGKLDDTNASGILSKSNVSDQLASSGAKSYATMTGSSASTASSGAAIVAESLNLSTKPADQVALQTKYNKINVEEKKQQQTSSSSSSSSSSCSTLSSTSSSSSIFSSLGSVVTTSDNPSVVMTSDSVGSGGGGSGSGGEQEVTAAAAAAEMLLDFSAANKDPMTKGGHSLPTSLTQHHLTTIPERAMTQVAPTVRRNTPPPPPPPPPLPAPFPPAASPSVSVHIVKSPAPSPRVIPPSPHSSASPCITDDELMDEALVGMGK